MEGSILMHAPPSRAAGNRLWLIAGTGEGPVLATALLRSHWRVRVSVVSRAAALAFGCQPGLEVRVGAIEGEPPDRRPEAGVAAELERAHRLGDPFRWVIDATHPFATRISAALAVECRRVHQPLLRLQRPELPAGSARILPDLSALGMHCPAEERLLLAIGARQLGTAMRCCPQAVHHARILPQPAALRQAMAAGLAPERVACLRPESDAAIERALCRQWRIGTIVCRRSGSSTELHWHRISEALGLRLLLLERPCEPPGVPSLPLEAMLEKLTGPHTPRT
jgi:precorrin-6A/cobalt-precorrin-6A reductase